MTLICFGTGFQFGTYVHTWPTNVRSRVEKASKANSEISMIACVAYMFVFTVACSLVLLGTCENMFRGMK